jgi:hypothetical protein
MQKTYIVWHSKGFVKLALVRTPFARLVNELEQAETETRRPRVCVGKARKLNAREFKVFCKRHHLCLASKGHGFSVLTRPDLIWPPFPTPML